jgi:hypothetical protein
VINGSPGIVGAFREGKAWKNFLGGDGLMWGGSIESIADM